MSKFDGVKKAIKERNSSVPIEEEEIVTTPEAAPLPERKSRKDGKRSDPNYVQVGVYVPKSLHLEIKKRLLDLEDLNMSDLVEQLLQDWLDKQLSD